MTALRQLQSQTIVSPNSSSGIQSLRPITGVSRHALRNRGRRSHRRRRANTDAGTPKSPGKSTIRDARSSSESLGGEDEKTSAPVALGSRRGIFSALAELSKEMRPRSLAPSGFRPPESRRSCGYPCRVRCSVLCQAFKITSISWMANRRFVAYFGLELRTASRDTISLLDRDFLEFMYAIPREQIVRVGQRRSLMKRALVDIVPNELLNRRRKAFIPPKTNKDNSAGWPS